MQKNTKSIDYSHVLLYLKVIVFSVYDFCVCVLVSSPTVSLWCSTPTWPASTRCCPTAPRPSLLRGPHLAFLLTQVSSLLLLVSHQHLQCVLFFPCDLCCCPWSRYVEEPSHPLLPSLSWRNGSDPTLPWMAVSEAYIYISAPHAMKKTSIPINEALSFLQTCRH